MDLGGPVVETWSYSGQIPGPEILVLQLTGGMTRYDWGFNGQSFDMSRPGALQFPVREGQRVG